jgi:hypothetical protein
MLPDPLHAPWSPANAGEEPPADGAANRLAAATATASDIENVALAIFLRRIIKRVSESKLRACARRHTYPLV